MNQQRFRIVFNRARGCLMAVAEVAKRVSGSGSSKGERSANSSANQGNDFATKAPYAQSQGLALWQSLGRQTFGSLALIVSSWSLVSGVAQAQIVADKRALGLQPTVLPAANGVPIINITTPGAGGISHNVYSQFDVGSAGAIFNNARTMSATQLAGWIAANPWLATGSARLILNEVRSANPSTLGGYLEVGGQKADVIIANPSGLNINGSGFINAGQVTLTTGLPSIMNGSVNLSVQGGQLALTGTGLDNRQADYTRLLAGQAVLNAGIWSPQLELRTGAAEYTQDGRTQASINPAAAAAGVQASATTPVWGIDVGQLGGMYAGKIVLQASQAGAGVRNAGSIGATAGGFSISADGRVVNTGSLVSNTDAAVSSANSRIEAQALSNSGSISSQGDLSLNTRAEQQNSGLISAGQSLNSQSTRLDNSGGRINAAGLYIDSAALLNSSGRIEQTGTQLLALQSQGVKNTGGQIGQALVAPSPNATDNTSPAPSPTATPAPAPAPTSAGDGSQVQPQAPAPSATLADGHIRITGLLDNDSGSIMQSGALHIHSSQGLSNTQGGNIRAQNLQVQGQTDNLGSTIQAGTLTHTGGLLNNDQGKIQALQGLSVVTQNNTISNTSGSISSGGTLNLNSGTATTTSNSGSIQGQQITLNAGSLDNSKGRIAAEKSAQLTVQGSSNNSQGEIASNGTLELNTGAALTNASGSIQSQGALNISAASIGNQAGKIQSNALTNVTSKGGTLDSTSGLISSTSPLKVDTQGAALINNAGRISGQDVTLNAGAIDNRNNASDGGIQAQNLNLNGSILDNRSGRIVSEKQAQLQVAGSTQNSSGQITSNGMLDINTSTLLSNDSGTIQSQGDLSLQAASINNQNGKILSNAAADILSKGGLLNNTSGQINSATTLKLDTQGAALSNTAGLISAKTVTINAGAMDNQNTASSGGGNGGIQGQDLHVNVSSLNNNTGRIVAEKSAQMTVTNSTSNNSGQIASNGTLDLNTGAALTNTSGTIQSLGDLTVQAASIANQAGKIQSNAAATLTSKGGTVDNSSGQISSGTALTLETQGAALINHAGRIAGQDMRISAGIIDNRNTQASGGLQGQTLSVNAASLDNSSQGRIVAETAATLTVTADINNSRGTIASNGTLNLNTGAALNNASGSIQSQGDMALQAASIGNRAGQIQSNGNATVTSRGGLLDNTNGQISSTDALTVNTQGAALNNSTGRIAAQDLTVKAESLDNRNTQTSGGLQGQTLNVTAASLDNTSGRVVADKTAQLSISGNTTNNSGQIASNGDLSLTSGGAVANTTGQIESGNDLRLSGLSLTGDGTVRAGRDADVSVVQDYTHTGTGVLQAQRNLKFATQGELLNLGKIQSAGDMQLSAVKVDNTVNGQILSDGKTQIDTSGDIVNRGLIDGSTTVLRSGGTLQNIGTGRIYGDQIAIQAQTLDNREETVNGTTKAAVIASRGDLDIGAQKINNQEHSLLYSLNDMRIGGSLNAQNTAQGRASLVNNVSATIESARNMQLGADRIQNSNAHFTTKIEDVGTPQQIVEYSLAGGDVARGQDLTSRFKPNEVRTFDCEAVCMTVIATGDTSDSWVEYNYMRTQQQTAIDTTDPGKIIAGGDLHLDSNYLLNDKSQVLAGGLLDTSKLVDFNNVTVQGKHYTTDSGTVTSEWRVRKRGRDRPGYGSYTYNPPVVETDIDLTPSRLEGNQSITGSSVTAEHRANVSLASGGTQTLVGTGSSSGAGVISTAAGAQANQLSSSTKASRGNNAMSSPLEVTQLTDGNEVRSLLTHWQVDNNSLFLRAPNSANYLVETDPQFTDRRIFSSSDYMLRALQTDPSYINKRLGDGFYEQKLVREQIAQLTGKRFLGNFRNDDTQYQALMNNGITFAKQFNLRPGIALTAQQVQALTSDMVWLEEQTVTLADGTTQRALVPKVYVRAQPSDVTGSGALLSAGTMDLKLSGTFKNVAGTVLSSRDLRIAAQNIDSAGGNVQAQRIGLKSDEDIRLQATSVVADQAIAMQAGRDVVVASTLDHQTNAQGERNSIKRLAQLVVKDKDQGLIAINAGQDARLVAAQISNAGTGDTVVVAGRDLTLDTLKTGQRDKVVFDASNHRENWRSQDVGTSVSGAGNVVLQAGRTLDLKAAQVQAGKQADLLGTDVIIRAGESNSGADVAEKHTSKGILSSRTISAQSQQDKTQALASNVEGQSVRIQSKNDLTVSGSNVLADQDVTLRAGNNLNIVAAQNTETKHSLREDKKSGLMSSGGVGFTVGKKEQSVDQQGTETTAAASTVGSLGGNVNLIAGQKYTQTGSDVIAPKGDITILAKKVDITEAQETASSKTVQKMKQSGLTVALSSPIISAAQGVQQLAKAAEKTQSTRMKGLAAAAAGLSLYNNAGAIADSAQQLSQGNVQGAGFKISVSVGSSKSESVQTNQSQSARGSSVKAGGNLTVVATGADKDSDITVQGSDLSAGKNALLAADDAITLKAAQNSSSQASTNSSQSGSVGVSFGAQGFTVDISASKSKGKGDGSETTYTNSHVNAGNTLTLQSGGDTTLQGAVAKAERVVADVGGDLKIESLQDRSQYKEQQSTQGFSLSIPMGPTGAFGASVTASKTNINSNYQSANEQSAIAAGDGGFDVRAKGNTKLIGGAITSTQKAVDDGVNHFKTDGTLTLTDLQNQAQYSASSVGGTLGMGSQLSSSNAGVGQDKGNASSVTTASISGIAGDKDKRSGDAQQGIKPIFDADTVKADVQAQVQITQAFGQNASKAVGDYGAKQLKEATALKQKADLTEDPDERNALLQKANDIESNWKEGGAMRVALHTLVGGLTGGVGGALGAAAASSAAPAIDALQAQLTEGLMKSGLSETASKNLASIVGSLTATGIGAAAGGGAGGATALNSDANNRQLHDLEIKLIKSRAKAFAKSLNNGKEPTDQQISDAESRLLAQGQRMVDAFLNDGKADGAAYNYIRSLQSEYSGKNDFVFNSKDGGWNTLFGATPNDFYDSKKFANTGDPAVRQQAMQEIIKVFSNPNSPGVKVQSAYSAQYLDYAKMADAANQVGKDGFLCLTAAGCLYVNAKTFKSGVEAIKQGDRTAGWAMIGLSLVGGGASSVMLKQDVTAVKEILTNAKAASQAATTQKQLVNLFNKSDESNQITLAGKSYEALPAPASNVRGTTKSFDTSQVADVQLKKDVFDYATKLSGGAKLQPVVKDGVPLEGRWTATTPDGTTINVRSVSSSTYTDGTKPRWTVDVINANIFKPLAGKPQVEVKFK